MNTLSSLLNRTGLLATVAGIFVLLEISVSFLDTQSDVWGKQARVARSLSAVAPRP